MARPAKQTKKTTNNTDTISLSEFRAWLSGVEDMQGSDDWSPTLDQWLKIRAKIDLIDDRPSYAESVQEFTTQERGRHGGVSQETPKSREVADELAERAVLARFGASVAPTSLDGVTITGGPGISSLSAPPIHQPPQQPTHARAPKVANIGGKTVVLDKTPDLDEGPYVSQFV